MHTLPLVLLSLAPGLARECRSMLDVPIWVWAPSVPHSQYLVPFFPERLLERVYGPCTTLDLTGRHLGDGHAVSLAAALKEMPALTTLLLSDNTIGDVGAAALAELLVMQSNLTTLDLSHNAVGRTGASALASALKDSPSLTSLKLDGNPINDLRSIFNFCHAAFKEGCQWAMQKAGLAA